MPRLTEAERQTAMTDFNGHYEELLLQHPGWEIEPNFGLVQLRQLETNYDAQVAAIDTIVATGMPAKRAQRDALFGTSSSDTDGLWFLLGLYKSNARLHLARHAPKITAKALSSTTPFIGEVSPGSYLSILDRFIDHWTLVNAAVPAANPLVIGTLTLAQLKAKRAEIAALIVGIDETVLTRLAVMRAEREQFFGDVNEDQRENDSILAYLLAYVIEVSTQFAGTPLAATLPRLFPAGGDELPRFPFNFRQSGGDVVVWFVVPVAMNAAVVYLKEGAFEETRAMPAAAPFKVTFSGIAVQDDLDEVELRDGNGRTLANGRFDSSLIEPV